MVRFAQRQAAPFHMIYHTDETASQPNISLLPDTREGYWDDKEAWNKRAVLGTAKYHIFFTRSKNGLK